MAMFDLVRVQTSTTGTGPIVAGAAVHGGRTPTAAGLPDGWAGSYAIEDGGQREVGQTVYTLSSGTFTRSMTASTTGSLLSLTRSAVFSLTALAADFARDPEPAVHNQSSPATEWTFNHNKGYRPLVEVLSPGGVEVNAEVVHVSVNQVKIYFNAPQTGQAIAR